MRTSTAAWAAALAVMSMSGPFTTAEAAPARAADNEQPRPVYGKLKKRQGFNDSDTNDPHGLAVRGVVPISGGSSSSAPAVTTPTPDPTPSDSKSDPVPLVGSILGQPDSTSSLTSTSIPLTTSVSEPADPSPPPSSNSDPGSDPAGSLLSSLLQPSGDSTSTLAPPAEKSSSGSDNDPLLGSITGQLSNVIPTPSGTTTGSGTIVVGITTVLQQTTTPLVPGLPGTGNSVPDSTQSGLLPNLNPSGLASGNILPTPSVPALQSGGPPLGTGLSGLTGTGIPSIVSSVESAASVPNPTGTGSGLSGLTGTGIPSIVSSVESAASVPNPTGTGSGAILPTITGTGGLPIPTITGTGGIPGVISSVKPDVTSILPPGFSGPGTAPVPTVVPNPSPIVSSVESEVTPNLTSTVDSITSNPTGTGNTTPPSGSTFTATVDGTSVVVTVPDSSATNTGVTAPPDSTTTTSAPVVTASNETESNKPLETSQRPDSSQSVTTNDTTPARTTTNTPSTSVLPTPPAPTTLASATPTSVQPQVSIVATGTDTQTTLSLPTVWSFAPKSSDTATASGSEGIASATTATDTSGGLPTTMPRLVQPATGMPNAPANFTLVQVGFSFGLNYPFVVGKPESAMQIFAYLPKGIAYGLGIPKENVLMNALMPYDTSQTLGYITTLAQTYIPSDLVNELQLHLHSPSSPIYLNPSSPVSSLMNMVNPTIPILPGAAMDGYSSSSSYNPAASTRAGEGDGAPIGGDSGSAKKVSGASVGIGLGAIGGAAVYAAAMIYVARRYRQKRKGHQRASSVPTAGEMTQRSSGGMGGLFMSGANGRNSPRTLVTNSGGRNSRTSNGSSNGRSIREQGISAPLMSENSLGWN